MVFTQRFHLPFDFQKESIGTFRLSGKQECSGKQLKYFSQWFVSQRFLKKPLFFILIEAEERLNDTYSLPALGLQLVNLTYMVFKDYKLIDGNTMLHIMVHL